MRSGGSDNTNHAIRLTADERMDFFLISFYRTGGEPSTPQQSDDSRCQLEQ
jgi:hypothetical protein